MVTLLPLLLALLGCGSAEPDPDVRRYVEAARLVGTDPAAAVAACEDVGGTAESECLAWAAAAVARTDPGGAVAVCARVQDEVWRDECGFLVAEESVASGTPEEAAKRCASAGRFADNCLMHLWKAHASSLIEARGLAGAATAFGPALGWADGVVTQDQALEERFWDLFFDAGSGGGQVPLDLAWCEELEGDLAGRCRRAIPASLQRSLNRADRRPSHVEGALDVQALCAKDDRPLHVRIEEAAGVRYAPHRELDAIADRFHARRCAGAPPDPGAPPNRPPGAP